MSSGPLPIGAIGVAKPEDILKALVNTATQVLHGTAPLNAPVSSSAMNISSDPGKNTADSKLKTQGLDSGTRSCSGLPRGETRDNKLEQLSTRRKRWMTSPSSASKSSATSGQSTTSNDSDGADAPVTGTVKQKRKKYHRHNRNSRLGEIQCERADILRNVPMTVLDARSELTKLVDGIIDNRPALKTLEVFEPSSLPDYIDKIGITREQAYAKMSSEGTNLPRLLDSTPHPVISHQDLPDCQTRRTQLEIWLAEALDLECRRADILEYQAKMWRAELVQEIKRFKVLAAVIGAGYRTTAGDNLPQATVLEAREAIDNLVALGTGKVIKIIPNKRRSSSRHNRWKGEQGVTAGGSMDSGDETSSSCASSGSSISWSSLSDDDD